MPRIEIELTSSRPDGVWTWRAAGARQPKGTLDASVLPPGAKVGDVLRAETDMGIDGITVNAVTPSKVKHDAAQRLEIIGSPDRGPLVTGPPGAGDERERRPRTERRPSPSRHGRDEGAPHGRRPGGDGAPRGVPGPGRPRTDVGPPSGPGPGRPRTDGGPPRPPARGDRIDRRPDRAPAGRGDGGRPGGPGGPGATRGGGRPGADRPGGPARPERDRMPRGPRADGPGRPPAEARPRPKRLQPARGHRDALLASLAPEQRPVAEQLLRGGIPAVRSALAQQNERAQATGEPLVPVEAILTMAEGLLPKARAAEWRDRAEAAVKQADEITLRDLRAVVVGSDVARDEDTRALAAQVREHLERRSTAEQQAWLAEITTAIDEGRSLRALRLSGRPPEPGVRFPAELAQRLSEAAGETLSAATPPDRWAAVLDALLTSPVRRSVQPQALPPGGDEHFLATVRAAAGRVPGLASLLGLDPTAIPPPPPPRPPRPRPATAGA